MTEELTVRRIVVGVDESEQSKHALRWAIEQAGMTGAVVAAVGVWQYPSTYAWGSVAVIDAAELADACERTLRWIRRRCGTSTRTSSPAVSCNGCSSPGRC